MMRVARVHLLSPRYPYSVLSLCRHFSQWLALTTDVEKVTCARCLRAISRQRAQDESK